MKKKNFIWVSALCACLSMGFVSCDDEDDPISADVPSAVVTGLSFTDENETLNMLSGTLSWTAPASVENVTKYVIYASSSATVKTEKLGEVNVGTNSFTLTDVTNLGYLLVFAANELGEAEACASIEVVDNEGTDGSIFQLYFLNSGNMGNNNATLTMYDPETGESDPDYFMTQNGHHRLWREDVYRRVWRVDHRGDGFACEIDQADPDRGTAPLYGGRWRQGVCDLL